MELQQQRLLNGRLAYACRARSEATMPYMTTLTLLNVYTALTQAYYWANLSQSVAIADGLLLAAMERTDSYYVIYPHHYRLGAKSETRT